MEHGTRLLDEIIAETKKKGDTIISGEDAFRLYDTFGFPLDLAGDIAEDAGLTIDMEGFSSHMEAQNKKARASWKGGAEKTDPIYKEVTANFPATNFTGYDQEKTKTSVLAIIKGRQSCR